MVFKVSHEERLAGDELELLDTETETETTDEASSCFLMFRALQCRRDDIAAVSDVDKLGDLVERPPGNLCEIPDHLTADSRKREKSATGLYEVFLWKEYVETCRSAVSRVGVLLRESHSDTATLLDYLQDLTNKPARDAVRVETQVEHTEAGEQCGKLTVFAYGETE